MGRPLNKKYFANTNYRDTGFANVGGEGVASVTIDAPIAASMNTGATVTFSAPQLTNGQAATGTVTIDGNGDITAITITSAGSGYTDVTAITITVTDTVAGGAETETLIDGGSGVSITLTSNARQNSIKCEAQVGAGSEVTTGDIIKQSSARRYKVQTSDGVAVCKLVTTNALGANEMSIMATDSDGKTYLVSKLTAHKAVLVPLANTHGGSTSAGTQFASGTSVKWSFTSTIENEQVRIANQ